MSNYYAMDRPDKVPNGKERKSRETEDLSTGGFLNKKKKERRSGEHEKTNRKSTGRDE